MILGYAMMGYMIYLIIVTQRIIPKIWDPYTILDISRVCWIFLGLYTLLANR